MSLARPPGKLKASQGGLVGRFLGFVIFVGLVGALGWAFFVTSQIDAFEVRDPSQDPPGEMVTLSNGQTIHYRHQGRGAPVVLIHGFDVAGSYVWADLAESLEGSRLVMPDQLDFGFSQRSTRQGRQHTVAGRAETLALLMEELGLEQADVVGAGMGGAVAAQLAADNPGLVDRLVLIAPEIYGPRPTWTEFFFRVPVIGPALTFTTLGGGAQAVARYQRECGVGWCPNADDLEYRNSTVMVRGTTAALVALAATPRASTVPADLDQIAAPTLLLWGGNDAVTPLADGRQMEAAIPGATLEVMATAGHYPHRQNPVEVAELIAGFLAG